jgi:hypothetical protein
MRMALEHTPGLADIEEPRAVVRSTAAHARARELAARPWRPSEERPHTPLRRFVAVGDPQAPAEVFFRVLARHDLIGDDGWLAPDVSLLSIGDHFDWKGGEPPRASRDGLEILRWLAAHAPTQTTILLGNHDTARVLELGCASDADFAEARLLAGAIARAEREVEAMRLRAEFARRYPSIPTPQLVSRDFNSYTAAQRALVVELLLAGRVALARSGWLPGGRELLFSHAAVTRRELHLLGIDEERRPPAIAARLNRFLADAVAAVAPAWRAGERVPLSLAPLHVDGAPGEEAGGLLAHRPVNPDPRLRPDADLAWELDAERPRRYDPRELPRGLLQAAGHTPHRTSLHELVGWLGPNAHAPDGLRTLRVAGDAVVYDTGILPVEPDEAGLYLIDGEMAKTDPEAYAVLQLAGWEEPPG